ncbi:hypothetical protein ACQ4PT_048811 [Festuca glaucescens]
MVEGSMQMASMSGDPTAKLTDDILTDIILHVPYKSTCCCKCVSTRWRDLISHPYHRKEMPQSLIGFFHESSDRERSRKWALKVLRSAVSSQLSDCTDVLPLFGSLLQLT